MTQIDIGDAKMLAAVESFAIQGLEALPIMVEVDVSNGLPSFDIVGLPNVAVREARERVRAAIKNSGLEFPLRRITVNLAPADVRKEGAVLDLGIALGVLGASGQLSNDNGLVVLGELSLDGSLRPVTGVLPTAIKIKHLMDKGIKKTLMLPRENYDEAKLVEGIDVAGVGSLREAVSILRGDLAPELTASLRKVESAVNSPVKYQIDFSEVKGQSLAKRALEVAAAGGHNILMVGSPGSGKTMLAKRVPTILPDMTMEEALEVSQIYSVSGLLPRGEPLLRKRPFRAPHHTSSANSVIGGGRFPTPGEISLAHNGVLFMDEFPEFKRDVLEGLRQPLEDGSVMVTRVCGAVRYPAGIMLVAAMNPCPCGFLGDSRKECLCTPPQINRYRSRLSGPLLDRIDMHIEVPRLEITDLMKNKPEENSDDIKSRVIRARDIQLYRFGSSNTYTNARMGQKEVKKYCSLPTEAANLLKEFYQRLNLSARSYTRVLKVARTIADLEGNERIMTNHIAEALQFRNMD